MIHIENVCYQIGSETILKDINLSIPKKQMTALVGPNGAGKSTLLSLIARLLPLKQGRIIVDELEVGQCPSKVLARKLSVLPQLVQMEARLSVRELVGFGRFPQTQGRMRDKDWNKVDDALAVFDLTALKNRALNQLSGGQRQRAFVAMSYAQDTPYMLLDEPLNNMDISASRALMQLLRKLCDSHGRTIIIVLHDMNYASGYADNIVAMCNGEIVRQGTPKKVVTEDFLKDIFATDAPVHMVGDRPIILV